jgi:hypothetical protein
LESGGLGVADEERGGGEVEFVEEALGDELGEELGVDAAAALDLA